MIVKMSFAALFMLLMIAQTSQGFSWLSGQKQRRCPKGWTGFGGHCYLFSKEKLAVKDAIRKCTNAISDGRLVQVSGSREEAWLELQIKIREMSGVWMGVSDIIKENTFLKLSNGKKIRYTHWNKGEPNNVNKKEHCVEWWGNGRWNDIPCDDKNFYICELP